MSQTFTATSPKPTPDKSPTTKRESTPTKNTAENRLTELTIDGENISSDSATTPQISPGVGARFFGSCAECGHRIATLGEACYAMGYLYHNACFVCCYCQRTLCGKTFYKDQEKIYCEEDYLYCGFQQTAEKCCVCGHLISEKILQAMGESYHPGCFTCSVCTKCLDGVPFATDANKLVYCLPDYHLVYGPLCGACGMVILPEKGSEEIHRVAALDREFHLNCYRCSDCKRLLGDEIENRCYPMNESTATDKKIQRLLCLDCHLSRIGAVPATTASPIPTTLRPSGGYFTPQLRFYPVSKFQGAGAKSMS